jgi:hypothetical protein
MIVITVSLLPEDAGYRATAVHAQHLYSSRSFVMESAVRNVVNQLAHHAEDQSVTIEWPTVVVQHRSLWHLAGIVTRDEQQRFCPACHAPVTGTKTYCNNTCRVRASRARSKRSA